MANELFEDLQWRGLLHQCTNQDALGKHLASGRRRVYAGFDPTADSLTIGNLVPIMLLVHLQQAGHQPVVVMGGGTGLIGDPSGKSAERQLLTTQDIANNVMKQRTVFERTLNFEGETAALIENNLDWLGELSFVEVLRDVGKHFSVNMMIQKDSVRERLHNREQGISYTEFSYMLLQAYDFLHLHQQRNVTIQVSGSDQWGNIVAGIDLARRVDQAELFGLTAPLVTKADGGKFGKTETGAIWLTPERTSPYAYYQFWLNAADADVERFLKIYTLLGKRKIEALMAEHQEAPGKRLAQNALAAWATRFLHGEAELGRAQAATAALFSGKVADLDRDVLDEAFATAPSTEHPKALAAEGIDLADLLTGTSLAKSKREAKEFLSNGAISMNGDKAAPDTRVTETSLLHGELLVLRRGRKHWHVARFG